MKQKDDFVKTLMNEVMRAIAKDGGSLSEMVAAEIENQIRKKYGGDEVYIQLPHDDRKQKALVEARKTGKPAEAAKRHGIPRSTIYRLLKK